MNPVDANLVWKSFFLAWILSGFLDFVMATLMLLFAAEIGTITTAQEIATFQSHNNRISAVAFSPDGKTLASGSLDNTAILWNLSTLKPKSVLSHPSAVYSVAFSPNGQLLATTTTDSPELLMPVGIVKLWKLDTGQELGMMQGDLLSNPYYSVSFSPNGTLVASGGCVPGRQRIGIDNADQGETILWEQASKKPKASFRTKVGPVFSLAFSPDGTTIAIGTGQADKRLGEVKVFDIITRKEKLHFSNLSAPIYSIAFSPDGKKVAAGGGTFTNIFKDQPDSITEVKIWEVATGKEIASLRNCQDPVYGVAFSPNGKLLVTGGGNKFTRRSELKLWDSTSYRVLATLQGHNDYIWSVAFSPDSTMLVLGFTRPSVYWAREFGGFPRESAQFVAIDKPLDL